MFARGITLFSHIHTAGCTAPFKLQYLVTTCWPFIHGMTVFFTPNIFIFCLSTDGNGLCHVCHLFWSFISHSAWNGEWFQWFWRPEMTMVATAFQCTLYNLKACLPHNLKVTMHIVLPKLIGAFYFSLSIRSISGVKQ